jgi:hypothetical protein
VSRPRLFALLFASLIVVLPTVAGAAFSQPSTLGSRIAGDIDDDGVPDATDPCPEAPGVGGCPYVDGDGVSDNVDPCPISPAGTNGVGGCPDFDADGVLDNVDKCLRVYGPDRTDGCEIAYGYVWLNFRKISDLSAPRQMQPFCKKPASEQATKCYIHLVVKLTPASAKALGLKDRTVYDISSLATKQYMAGPQDYYHGIPPHERVMRPAAARALKKASKATFVATATFRWSTDPLQTMKLYKTTRTSAVFTLTTKNVATNPYRVLESPRPAKRPARA